MKMGITIYKGTKEEVQKEFESLLLKAREGFGDEVLEKVDEFIIVKSDIRISFCVDKMFQEFAIFQIIN